MNSGDLDSEEVAQRCPPCCSFCGKGSDDLESLIEGPFRGGSEAVYICKDCVELCSSIFEMQKYERGMGERDYAALARQVEKVLEPLPLTPQEREIIWLRYGLADGPIHTHDEVCQRFGITPERLREIEGRVIAMLRSIPSGLRGN